MFCRGGKILDSFIPIDKNSGKKRGFAFVRFGSIQEAEKAVELARGRSWGGRKIQVQLSKYKQVPNPAQENENLHRKNDGEANPWSAGQVNPWSARQANPWSARQAWNAGLKGLMKEDTPSKKVGWIMRNGDLFGVRIVSNVIKEGKENLIFSLVGFLEKKGQE